MRHDLKHRRRWLIAVLAVLFTGLAALPIVLHIDSAEIDLDSTGVVANTLDTYFVTEPVVLESIAQMTLTSGTVTIAARDSNRLTGNQALQLVEGGLADLVLRRAELRFGGGRAADPSGGAGQGAPILGALRSGRFANLRMDDSTISIVLPHGGSELLERVKGTFMRIGKKAIRGTGHGHWRGQKVRFTFKSDGRAQAKAEAIPFEIEISGKLLSVAFAGTVSNDAGLKLDGHGELRTPDLKRLALALGASWPDSLGGRAFAIRGPFSWVGHVASFPKATVAIDVNEATGAVSINSAGQKAVFAGTLAFEEFDLAAYVGAATEQSTLPDTAGGITLPSWLSRLSDLWTVPMVHQIDADFRISAKKIKWRSAELGPAALALGLKAGKVSIHLAELLFEGGAGGGQISLDFNGYLPQMTLRGRLVSAPIGQLSDALFGVRYLSGTATVTGDLLASGYSMRELIGSLSGTIEVDLPAGALVKLNLHALEALPISVAKASDGEDNAGRIVAAMREGTTPVRQVSATILLNNGTLEVRSATAVYDKGYRVAKLTGRLGLANNHMRFQSMLRLRTAAERSTDAASAKRPGTPGEQTSILAGRLVIGRGGLNAPDVTLSDHKDAAVVLDRMI